MSSEKRSRRRRKEKKKVKGKRGDVMEIGRQ